MGDEIINLFTAIVSLISFVFLAFLLTKNKRENANKTKSIIFPPGPRKLPIIGNLHQIRNPPHRSLQNLSRKHGDLMFLQLGLMPTLVVSSADKAQEIFKSYDRVFSGRPPLYTLRKLSYNCSGITAAPYGDQWRDTRKVTALELMTPKRIKSFGSIRVQEVASMLDQIASNYNDCVDLSSLVCLLTENVIRRVLLGKSVDAGRFMIHDFQQLAAEFNLADYFPGMDWINRLNGVDRRLDEAARDLDRLIDKIIEERVDPMRPQSDDVEDMIDALIGIQKDPSRAITMTNTQIKAILLLVSLYIYIYIYFQLLLLLLLLKCQMLLLLKINLARRRGNES